MINNLKKKFKSLFQSFINPEDLLFVLNKEKAIVQNADESVERVRRAHLNDLENILPFFIAAWFYVLTNPEPFIAINLFRTVAISRITHTIVYAVVPIPQPARAIAYHIAVWCTIYMIIISAIFFM